MQSVIQELNSLIADFTKKFEAISEAEFSAKPMASKWSKKEVVGHLIDSAQNNLRRFILGQYETSPTKIVYDQDFWVNSNGYQSMKKEDVIELWKLINGRIAVVLSNMSPAHYKNQALASQLYTLEFLAEDYVRHMKHHLNQVVAGSFDIVYKS